MILYLGGRLHCTVARCLQNSLIYMYNLTEAMAKRRHGMRIYSAMDKHLHPHNHFMI